MARLHEAVEKLLTLLDTHEVVNVVSEFYAHFNNPDPPEVIAKAIGEVEKALAELSERQSIVANLRKRAETHFNKITMVWVAGEIEKGNL